MLRSIVLFVIMGTAAASGRSSSSSSSSGCTTLWEPQEFPTDASECHEYLEKSGWTFGTNGNSELLVCNTPSYPNPADYFSFYVYGVNDESTNPNSHISRELPKVIFYSLNYFLSLGGCMSNFSSFCCQYVFKGLRHRQSSLRKCLRENHRQYKTRVRRKED